MKGRKITMTMIVIDKAPSSTARPLYRLAQLINKGKPVPSKLLTSLVDSGQLTPLDCQLLTSQSQQLRRQALILSKGWHNLQHNALDAINSLDDSPSTNGGIPLNLIRIAGEPLGSAGVIIDKKALSEYNIGITLGTNAISIRPTSNSWIVTIN